VTNGSLLFQGLADQTLGHNQSWQFIQLGKFLERIDVTCRVIETKFDTLRSVERSIETTERNMHLLSVVRSCCALEFFRRSAAHIDPHTRPSFLFLKQTSPRCVCFPPRHAHDATRRISQQISTAKLEPAEGILGRLLGDLQYTPPTEIAAENLPPFLQKIQ